MTQMNNDEKIARISDVLEQIQELNKMLDFLTNNQADESSVRQYTFMRKNFVEELSILLKDFKLGLVPVELAA